MTKSLSFVKGSGKTATINNISNKIITPDGDLTQSSHTFSGSGRVEIERYSSTSTNLMITSVST